MKTLAAVCIAWFVSLIPASGFAEVNLVLNVAPGIFVYSPDADGFKVSDGINTGEVDGYLSNMATVTGGIGFNTPGLFFDVTGGVGYLYNSAFTSKILMADAALRFKIRREELTAGPHISFMKYKPDWEGDANVSLSDDTGIMAGLGITIGSKEFSISASVDYIKASFDVDPPGISVNREPLDISGIALQIGMILRF
ncbi:MAG: DUF481 domain-containing protein [Desulfobacterales bacterium]|nr:DUF481 domain-containing protein [Desulfobacterales bacterium]